MWIYNYSQIQIQFKKRKQSPNEESDFKGLLYAVSQQNQQAGMPSFPCPMH